ncbi:MAG TPA: hypothetical protein VFE47_19655 [Tepidisphaeraceae bacterium]|jgi:hypothetical protein|nr:hypothetical protein [Tepidisphaeraceae bacterium]
MGQLAKDWTQLKTIIRQKDDALDRQTAQIADLQKQLTAHQQQALDNDDLTAVAELRKTVATNAAAETPPSAPPATAPAPAVAHPVVAPHAVDVATFTK